MSLDRVGKKRLQGVDRAQMLLRPVIVEELIADDHPARAIWEFVGRLDLARYLETVRSLEGTAGRPAIDPQLLVSLWIYSYSRGVSSARAIERLCDHDPAYQWLTGMASINAHTLSDFRVDHADALHDLFVQVLGLLSAEGLITLERVMQDGTKVRANAASSEFRTQGRIEEHLQLARAAVDALETISEDDANLQRQRARARAAREKQERLERAVRTFDELKAASSTVTRVSTADPDARVMKQADGGTAPSYNVQVVTDAGHNLIVDIEPTQAGSDYRQLLPAMARVEEHCGRRPGQVVADGGYVSSQNIVAMAERGIDFVAPEPARQARDSNREKSYGYRGVNPAYESTQFRYVVSTNTYVCPQGQLLRYDAKYPCDGSMRYRYKAAAETCRSCPAKPVCCPRTAHGRSIERLEPLPAMAAFRERMQTDAMRAIYKTRSQVAEFPHLWIKAKLGLRQFRVRSLSKVRMEARWAALTYDIQQWIRLRWRPQRTTQAVRA